MLFAQCIGIDTLNMPPTPYYNGFVYFDGSYDFARSTHLDELDFVYSSTLNFKLSFDLKILELSRSQYVFGQYPPGWILGYNFNNPDSLCFYISNNSYNNGYVQLCKIVDTNWHHYEIQFSKSDSVLKAFADGVLIKVLNNYHWSYTPTTNYAFSLGSIGLQNNYGPNTITGNPLYYLRGYLDNLIISKNSRQFINYDFNECAGQVIRDSASYFISDRTYPGVPLSPTTYHLQMGYGPAPDSCDPKWITNNQRKNVTRYSPLGHSFGNWNYAECFSLGMTVWNNNLFVGGVFDRIGNDSIRYIAQWNGTNWSSLGAGLNLEPVYLCSYNNNLIATGHFDSIYRGEKVNYIAKWNGTTWSSLGLGLDSYGFVACEFRGDLIVGGIFTSAGGIQCNSIAGWNGENWFALGSGVTGSDQVIYALSVYRDELYVGGIFTSAGGVQTNCIAKWNGSKWSSVGTGIKYANGAVAVLYVFENKLWAGGHFSIMNGITVNGICTYDGSNWQSVGAGVSGLEYFIHKGYVTDIVSKDNSLYVTGSFTRMDNKLCNKISKWDGFSWCPLDYGLDLRGEELEIYNNHVIICGDFFTADGIFTSNIVQYSPSSITQINSNQNVIKNYSLSQNYLNPFNPITRIRFSIPAVETGFKPVYTKIVIYDILGKEMAILVNEELQPGTYEAEWNATNYPSGIYFYKILAGEFSETKKMILVK